LLSVLLITIVFAAGAGEAQAAPLHQDAVYVVKAGDSLLAIAQRYGISLQSIMAANRIDNPSLIYTGQRLVIPGSQPPEAAPAEPATHVVAPGETLSAIAQRYGVSLQALVEANSIGDASRIAVGQRLAIPAAGSNDSVPAAPAAAAPSEYVVGPGEGLAAIAQQFNTTVAALAAVNGIGDPSRIYVGQRLIIPADAAAPAAQTTPQGGLHFYVSISQQRCQLYRGEQLLYNWPCSTGRAGSGTKTGQFFVQSKIREAWGSRWGFYMPYWLGIYWAGGSENGIHGLPYQPGGYPVWANAVGTPITYGCVLLGANESQVLWDMAYIGMPVTIR
jgi:LysM repeat protein